MNTLQYSQQKKHQTGHIRTAAAQNLDHGLKVTNSLSDILFCFLESNKYTSLTALYS